MHFLDFTFVKQVFVYIIHVLVTPLFYWDISTANIMLHLYLFLYFLSTLKHFPNMLIKVCKAVDNVLNQVEIIAVTLLPEATIATSCKIFLTDFLIY